MDGGGAIYATTTASYKDPNYANNTSNGISGAANVFDTNEGQQYIYRVVASTGDTSQVLAATPNGPTEGDFIPLNGGGTATTAPFAMSSSMAHYTYAIIPGNPTHAYITMKVVLDYAPQASDLQKITINVDNGTLPDMVLMNAQIAAGITTYGNEIDFDSRLVSGLTLPATVPYGDLTLNGYFSSPTSGGSPPSRCSSSSGRRTSASPRPSTTSTSPAGSGSRWTTRFPALRGRADSTAPADVPVCRGFSLAVAFWTKAAILTVKAMNVVIGAKTDPGRRPNNEDQLAVVDVRRHGLRADGVLVIADGMGGRSFGEKASAAAVETVQATLIEMLAAGRADAVDTGEALASALRKANARVYELGHEDEAHQGMGTTCVAAVVQGETLSIAHAGDSRAYLLRDGALERLTDDHSYVAEQVRAGVITEESAQRSRFRNVITRAIGIEPTITPDLSQHPLRPGDTVLLCTDGLTNMVPEDQIARVMQQAPSPQSAADRLIQIANRNGGKDNITAVVARLEISNRTQQMLAEELSRLNPRNRTQQMRLEDLPPPPPRNGGGPRRRRGRRRPGSQRRRRRRARPRSRPGVALAGLSVVMSASCSASPGIWFMSWSAAAISSRRSVPSSFGPRLPRPASRPVPHPLRPAGPVLRPARAGGPADAQPGRRLAHRRHRGQPDRPPRPGRHGPVPVLAVRRQHAARRPRRRQPALRGGPGGEPVRRRRRRPRHLPLPRQRRAAGKSPAAGSSTPPRSPWPPTGRSTS